MLSRRMVVNRITYMRRRYNNHRKLLANNPQLNRPDWFTLMDEAFATIEQRVPNAPPRAPTTAAAAAMPTDNSNHSSSLTGGGQIPHSSTNSLEHHPDATMPSTTGSRADRITRQLDAIQQLDRSVQQTMLVLRTLAHEEATAAVRGIETTGANDTLRDRNEFDAFGRNVASQLEQMPLEVSINCQHAIQSVLRVFRLRHNGAGGTTTTAAEVTMPNDSGQEAADYQHTMHAMQSPQQQQQQHCVTIPFSGVDHDLDQQMQAIQVECMPSMFSDNSVYGSQTSQQQQQQHSQRSSTPNQRRSSYNVDADDVDSERRKKRKKSSKRKAEQESIVSFVDILDSDD